MAWRLNTLLHEMKMKPVAALTTKDQLETLFRTEVVRMGEHLDNLQFAARRVGSNVAVDRGRPLDRLGLSADRMSQEIAVSRSCSTRSPCKRQHCLQAMRIAVLQPQRAAHPRCGFIGDGKPETAARL